MMGGLTTGVRRTAAGLAAAAVCLGMTACETTGGGLTSQYFGPEGGGLYRYGNFCGPGWPEYPEGNTPQQNVALIDALQPVDDLDRVCRAHDRCYFDYGMDNAQCDAMFASMLGDTISGQFRYAAASSFLDNEFKDQCANLAAEMLVAVGQFKQEGFVDQLTNDDNFAMATGLLLGVNAMRNLSSGFPEVPGLCFFNPDHLSTAYTPAEEALQAAAGGRSVSLNGFEPFAPSSESSLAAGRAALAAFLAAQAAAAEDGTTASP